jgi:plastocyanin
MTWLSRTCSSGLLLLAWAASPLAAASVRGTVEVVDSRSLHVRRSNDYAGVVVWLEPASPAASRPPASGASPVFEMRQKDKMFVPHLLTIPVGAAVAFPNLDPIFHNAFSNFNGQLFDVGLYRPGSSRTVRFQREGVVRVFCNIHPTMSAVIIVLKDPYFTVSTKTGAFEISGVPAGEYRLHVFHERAPAEALQSLDRQIVVQDATVALPVIRISEAGYLPAPHANKYGKPYPRVIEDHRAYEGGDK